MHDEKLADWGWTWLSSFTTEGILPRGGRATVKTTLVKLWKFKDWKVFSAHYGPLWSFVFVCWHMKILKNAPLKFEIKSKCNQMRPTRIKPGWVLQPGSLLYLSIWKSKCFQRESNQLEGGGSWQRDRGVQGSSRQTLLCNRFIQQIPNKNQDNQIQNKSIRKPNQIQNKPKPNPKQTNTKTKTIQNQSKPDQRLLCNLRFKELLMPTELLEPVGLQWVRKERHQICRIHRLVPESATSLQIWQN